MNKKCFDNVRINNSSVSNIYSKLKERKENSWIKDGYTDNLKQKNNRFNRFKYLKEPGLLIKSVNEKIKRNAKK